MNWPTIEDAIQSAIASALAGVPGLTVQWGNQRLPEPVRPFIKLKRGTVIGHGMAERRNETDLEQPAGQEIELAVVQRVEFSVSVHAYAAGPVGADTAGGILEQLKARLLLESNLALLEAGGLALVETSDVRDLPESGMNSWSSRAQLDASFYATSVVSERTGYIETVELTNETTGETFTAPE
jgi:hypothetical protein